MKNDPSSASRVSLNVLWHSLVYFLFALCSQVAKLFSYSWTMGEFLCKAVHYIQNVSAISSVLTLTAMSTERCVYIH